MNIYDRYGRKLGDVPPASLGLIAYKPFLWAIALFGVGLIAPSFLAAHYLVEALTKTKFASWVRDARGNPSMEVQFRLMFFFLFVEALCIYAVWKKSRPKKPSPQTPPPLPGAGT